MNVHYFKSLTELKTTTVQISIGDVCCTLGYYNQLDGGAAKYLIISKTSGIVDDGGYYIELTANRVAQLIVENNEINVLQYGAHKNWIQYPNEPSSAQWGNFDNREIFAKVTSRAHTLGCNVYFPSGIYMCIPTSNLPNTPGYESGLITAYSNMIIRGDGADTIITIPSIAIANNDRTYFRPMLKCDWWSKGIIIRDIVLDGNKHEGYIVGNDQMGFWGVELPGVTNVLVDNVRCQNFEYVGFRMQASIRKTTFRFCTATNVDCGFITIGSSPSSGTPYIISDLTITNCLVDGHRMSEGIALFQSFQSNNVVIANNIIKNKTNANGILIGRHDVPASDVEYFNKNVTIIGNHIQAVATGISIAYGSHIVLQGNILDNPGYDGIHIKQCKDISIFGNQISWVDGRNIYITASSHLLVHSNIIKDNNPNSSTSTNSHSHIHTINSSHISFYNNQIYQEEGEVKKYIVFNEGCSDIVFDNNDIYHDSNITQIWLNSTDTATQANSLKNSYIRLPLHTDIYNTYIDRYNSNRISNYIGRRTDKLRSAFIPDINNYNQWDEVSTVYRLDSNCNSVSNLILRPVDTRIIIHFPNTRAVNTSLSANGNIRFSSYNSIYKNDEWIMEFICLGDKWVELSRNQIS